MRERERENKLEQIGWLIAGEEYSKPEGQIVTTNE